MSFVRDIKFSEPIKSLIIAFLLSIPFSYLLTTLYLDIGGVKETILVTSVISLLSGLIIHNVKFLLITIFLSIIFALAIGACMVAYPLIKLSSEISYIPTIYFTAALTLTMKTFTMIFFIILPFSLLFNIIGAFLADILM